MPFIQFLIDLINNFNSVSYGLGGTFLSMMLAILIYYIAKVIKGILDYYYNKLIIPLLKSILIHLPIKITGKAIVMMDGKTIDGKIINVINNESESENKKSSKDESASKSKNTSKPAQDIDIEEFKKGSNAYKEKNYELAFKIWKPLAKKGLANAQFGLAILYDFSYGVEQDEDKAMEWYIRAAEQGHVKAQFNLGIVYSEKEKYKETMKWYSKAAEQGHSGAQNNLGDIHYNGKGIPKNIMNAYIWLSLASANGNITSKNAFESLEEELTPDNLQRTQKEVSDMIKENPNLIRQQSDFD